MENKNVHLQNISISLVYNVTVTTGSLHSLISFMSVLYVWLYVTMVTIYICCLTLRVLDMQGLRWTVLITPLCYTLYMLNGQLSVMTLYLTDRSAGWTVWTIIQLSLSNKTTLFAKNCGHIREVALLRRRSELYIMYIGELVVASKIYGHIERVASVENGH